jgi:hypothetical protein
VESIAIALVNGTSELDKTHKPYPAKSQSNADDSHDDDDFDLNQVDSVRA